MKKVSRVIAIFLSVFMIIGMSSAVNAAPAPPVSKVQVVDYKVNEKDGYLYVIVSVTGYGKAVYATYDNMQVYVSDVESVGRPIVTGEIYTVKCKRAIPGTHNFMFRITSVNSPWNTVSVRKTINL